MKIHLSNLDGPPERPETPRAAPWIALGLLALAVLAVYGRALHRGFTSEDFLLLRVLRAEPPWRDFAGTFGSPWLGLQLFQFYRPVSTFLFALEGAVFGTASFAYTLAHTLVHVGNAYLVYAIARRLTRLDARPGEGSAFVAALLFALHPVHPNAVVFVASFATLFAASFLLAAFLCHVVAGEGGPAALGWRAAALGLFALALGSYEAASVLPVLFVAYDLLVDARPVPWRSRLAAWVPPFALLGGYFALRLALFGNALGGYEETRKHLLAPSLGDLVRSLHQIYLPLLDRPLGTWGPLVSLLVVGLLPLAWLAAAPVRRPTLRLWLFAWVWTVVSLLPFAFRPVAPANARYLYLAVVGAAWGIAFLARSLAAALPGPWRILPLAGMVGIAIGSVVLLWGHLGATIEAGQTARTIADQLAPLVAAPTPKGASPIFVGGVPQFVNNRAGAPEAQVFHYGLADSVAPPFGKGGSAVYPLPPLKAEELLPLLLGRPNSRICEWEPSGRRLRQVFLYPSPSTAELAVITPADGSRLAPGALFVTVQPGTAKNLRLIVLARGNPVVAEPVPEPAAEGAVRLALPRDFLVAMDRLYGGDVYWWVEARNPDGALRWTRMRAFRLAGRAGGH